MVSVITTFGIVVALIPPKIEFFQEVNPFDFFTGTEWSPLFAQPEFGVLPLLAGTFVVTLCALAVCIPFGLGSAIYLSEYAHRGRGESSSRSSSCSREFPTVVYGFFAVVVISPVVQDLWPIGNKPGAFNALAAGIVMGVMIIPTVASVSEDAMSAVPHGLREGAYAVGSTKREVATRVVFRRRSLGSRPRSCSRSRAPSARR